MSGAKTAGNQSGGRLRRALDPGGAARAASNSPSNARGLAFGLRRRPAASAKASTGTVLEPAAEDRYATAQAFQNESHLHRLYSVDHSHL
jgi:hypothetical protein